MCMSAPDIPDPQPVPERVASRAPDNGDPTTRTQDQARRRLALAASIFTPIAGLGAPATTAASKLGV